MNEIESIILYIITIMVGTPVIICFTTWITTEFLINIKNNIKILKGEKENEK